MSKGVLLVNLGSPDSTDPKDVKKYLDEFLMDPRVIDVPLWARTLLVRGIILNTRPKKSAAAYQKIWWEEGSPLIVLSERLQKKVSDRTDIPIGLAMRYGSMSIKKGLQELYDQGIKEVMIFPLYPQFAMAGVPERHIRKSDVTQSHCKIDCSCCNTPSSAHEFCYRHQCYTTTKMVAEQLSLPEGTYSTSFQSRLGFDPWLQPYTDRTIERLGKEGIKKMAIVTPAFVSDCLETLEEIAMEGEEIFHEVGGKEFTTIPCLNDRDDWADLIANWINKWALVKTQTV
mgnify:CR=1 FL=1